MRQVAFLILPEFSHLGLAAAVEPLFVANWLARQRLFDWTLVSVDGAPVRASNGLVVPVHGDLESAGACRTVFVLASFEPDRSGDPRVTRWLRRIARFGGELCGLENGSWMLAAAGLLGGRKVAVHWDNLAGFQERFPRTKVLAHLFARSGERITCAGASSILDLMVAWIGWHGHADLAGEVADHLLLGGARSGETEQGARQGAQAARESGVLAAAEGIMQRHVDEPLSCAAVARRAGLSLRQLERVFKQRLGCSVLQRYRLIRMSRAHQLLQQTDLSVTQVALASGFSSPEYFCRLYRSFFDCSPSRDRRQSTQAPVLRHQRGRRPGSAAARAARRAP